MRIFTRDKSFYRSFFTLTGLMALQNVITCSVSLADNVMLGAYSESALSGVALANQIQFLLQMLIMGVGDAVVVLASQYWGKEDTESIRKLTNVAFRIGALIGLVFWFVIFFFPSPCLRLFTDDEVVIAQGAEYLKVICFSYLFFSMTNVLLACLKSVETVKIGFVVSFSTLCINVCLNYLLIYGHFGRPGLGAQGAAIATLTSRVIEFLIVLAYLKRFDQKICLSLSDFRRIDWILAKDYLKTGLPVVGASGIWGLAMAVQVSILGHLGAMSIAANSVTATIFQILTVVIYGAAGAASVLTGKTIGEGRSYMIREYTKTFQILFLIIGVFTGLGLYLIKDVILSFYAISGETKELASQFITVLSVTVVGTAYQCPCLTGVVRGGGDTKFVLYNDSIFMWGIVLPFSAMAAFWWKLPPTIVFLFLKSDQILKCFVAAVKVNRYTWIRELTRTGSEEVPMSAVGLTDQEEWKREGEV